MPTDGRMLFRCLKKKHIECTYDGLFSRMSAVVELAMHSSLLRLPEEQAEGQRTPGSSCSSSASMGVLDFHGNLRTQGKGIGIYGIRYSIVNNKKNMFEESQDKK